MTVQPSHSHFKDVNVLGTDFLVRARCSLMLDFATVEGLLDKAGIIEVAAGTGYWAWYLHAAHSLPVAAYDVAPPAVRGAADVAGVANEYHGRLPAWAPVHKGDAAAVATRAGREHATLLLCYAPPDDHSFIFIYLFIFIFIYWQPH
jgi:hypothetical protein